MSISNKVVAAAVPAACRESVLFPIRTPGTGVATRRRNEVAAYLLRTRTTLRVVNTGRAACGYARGWVTAANHAGWVMAMTTFPKGPRSRCAKAAGASARG